MRAACAKALQKKRSKPGEYRERKRPNLAQRDRMRGRVLQTEAGEVECGQSPKALVATKMFQAAG